MVCMYYVVVFMVVPIVTNVVLCMLSRVAALAVSLEGGCRDLLTLPHYWLSCETIKMPIHHSPFLERCQPEIIIALA